MSDAHWSQMMMPGERICQLENVNAELGIEVRTLRQQLEQADARVAELEAAQQYAKGTLLCPKWAEAQILRKQAEAVESVAEDMVGMNLLHPDGFVRMKANRLRAKAEEQEKGND